MTEQNYPEGLFLEEIKFDNGGSIIKQTIKVEEFCSWLQKNKNENGKVKLDIKWTRDGEKVYATINTFKSSNNSEENEKKE